MRYDSKADVLGEPRTVIFNSGATVGDLRKAAEDAFAIPAEKALIVKSNHLGLPTGGTAIVMPRCPFCIENHGWNRQGHDHDSTALA